LSEIINITKREKQILQYLSYGYTTNEIASKLDIASTTVITYKNRLREKTGARNCVELIYIAATNNLIVV